MRFISLTFLSCLFVATAVSAQVLSPQTIVCKPIGCAGAGTLEKNLLQEQMQLMFKTNLGQQITLCQGAQECTVQGISVPVTVQNTPRLLTLSQATLTDAAIDKESGQIKLILAYEARLNQFAPICQSAAYQLTDTNGQMTLGTNGFTCALAGQTKTHIKVDFTLNTVDLGNAVLGGFYTITATGAAVGQSSGHVFLKLAKKTPVTLDEKSIGVVLPNKDALLEQARAEMQAKQQQRILEQYALTEKDEAILQQMLMQNGGQDGIYTMPTATTPALDPMMQPVYVQPEPVMQPISIQPQPEIIYYQ